MEALGELDPFGDRKWRSKGGFWTPLEIGKGVHKSCFGYHVGRKQETPVQERFHKNMFSETLQI